MPILIGSLLALCMCYIAVRRTLLAAVLAATFITGSFETSQIEGRIGGWLTLAWILIWVLALARLDYIRQAEPEIIGS